MHIMHVGSRPTCMDAAATCVMCAYGGAAKCVCLCACMRMQILKWSDSRARVTLVCLLLRAMGWMLHGSAAQRLCGTVVLC